MLPPWSQPRNRVRHAAPPTSDRIEPLDLFAKRPVDINATSSEQQMRVKISIVTISRRCVQCTVNSHSKLIRDLLREIKR
jgi:hypothetical protein